MTFSFFYINTIEEYFKPRFELVRKEINIIMDFSTAQCTQPIEVTMREKGIQSKTLLKRALSSVPRSWS